MQRVNNMLTDATFKECLEKISGWEKERQFCRHDTNHFLNVARIAMILNLSENMGIEKEHIYAAALLHDIGRHIQYENGMDHAAASAKLAPAILIRAGFDEREIAVINEAIANHRNKTIAKEKNLKGLLYRADKLSRECCFCKVQKECDWADEKKNLFVEI